LQPRLILPCMIAMGCIASELLFAAVSVAQSEPQHKLTSVMPCYDNSDLPQTNVRIQSASADVATGALPFYEIKAAAITPHEPDNVKLRKDKPHTIASIGPMCDGFRAMNISMHVLLENAFGLDKDYVVGAPGWTNDENYDVRIVFGDETIDAINKLTPEKRIRAERAALAPFLADTLRLTTHHTSNSRPVYELTVGKKGLKFHEALEVHAATAGLTVFKDSYGGYVLTGHAARIDTLTMPLQKVLERVVVNHTGLTGLYDFVLTFYPQAQTYTSMAQMNAAHVTKASVYTKSVIEAIDKQLGLKLNSLKDSVEVISIDHIDKPAKK
jgi:uncharacterized protein (TIGR03435 family)